MKNIPVKLSLKIINILECNIELDPLENDIYLHIKNHKEIPILLCFEYLKEMEEFYGDTVESIILQINTYRLRFPIDKYVLTHLCDEKIIKQYLLWKLITN